MNIKGNAGLAVLTAAMFFVCGMIMLNFVMDDISTARTALSCAVPAGLSDGTKILCLGLDATVVYLILAILAITIGVVTEKYTQ